MIDRAFRVARCLASAWDVQSEPKAALQRRRKPSFDAQQPKAIARGDGSLPVIGEPCLKPNATTSAIKSFPRLDDRATDVETALRTKHLFSNVA
jgi:hypothetical protein